MGTFEVVIRKLDGQALCRMDMSKAELMGKRVMVGRAEDCDLRIAAPSVSRHHCVIEQDEDEQWIVRDLGSTHGVQVDGERVNQVELRDGLKVCIGPAVLEFQNAAERPVPAGVASAIAREFRS